MNDADDIKLEIPEGPAEPLVNRGQKHMAQPSRPTPSRTEPPIQAPGAQAPLTIAQLTSSPEFQAILAAAVAQATSAITSQLEAARAAAGTVPESTDSKFAKELAMHLVQISDQGSKKVRVAPDEMSRREEGKQRVLQLLVDARAGGRRPQYELTRPQFLEEQLIPPTFVDRMHVARPTQIEFYGMPNEGMIPLNDAAVEIYAAFDQWLGVPTKHQTRAHTPDVAEDKGDLRVMHQNASANKTPQVGRGREPTITMLGQTQAGELKEKRVLGTVAAPARQRQ